MPGVRQGHFAAGLLRPLRGHRSVHEVGRQDRRGRDIPGFAAGHSDNRCEGRAAARPGSGMGARSAGRAGELSYGGRWRQRATRKQPAWRGHPHGVYALPGRIDSHRDSPRAAAGGSEEEAQGPSRSRRVISPAQRSPSRLEIPRIPARSTKTK